MATANETVASLARRIKGKHPEYAEREDGDLVRRWIQKFPEYQNRLSTKELQGIVAPGISVPEPARKFLQERVVEAGQGVLESAREVMRLGAPQEPEEDVGIARRTLRRAGRTARGLVNVAAYPFMAPINLAVGPKAAEETFRPAGEAATAWLRGGLEMATGAGAREKPSAFVRGVHELLESPEAEATTEFVGGIAPFVPLGAAVHGAFPKPLEGPVVPKGKPSVLNLRGQALERAERLQAEAEAVKPADVAREALRRAQLPPEEAAPPAAEAARVERPVQPVTRPIPPSVAERPTGPNLPAAPPAPKQYPTPVPFGEPEDLSLPMSPAFKVIRAWEQEALSGSQEAIANLRSALEKTKEVGDLQDIEEISRAIANVESKRLVPAPKFRSERRAEMAAAPEATPQQRVLTLQAEQTELARRLRVATKPEDVQAIRARMAENQAMIDETERPPTTPEGKRVSPIAPPTEETRPQIPQRVAVAAPAVPPAAPAVAAEPKLAPKPIAAAVPEKPPVIAPGAQKAPQAAVVVRTSDLATDPARFQPREGLADGRVQWIAEQMRQRGYDPKEPLTTWTDPKDGRTYVIAGHHRLEAARQAGVGEVPVYRFEGTEAEALAYARRSNSQPAPMSPIAEAKAFAAELAEGRTAAEISKLYGGVKESVVEDRLALNNLAPQLKAMVESPTAGGKVFKLPLATALGKAAGKHKLSPELQMEIFDKFILKYDMTPAKLGQAIDTLAPIAQQQMKLGLGFEMEKGFTDALVNIMDRAEAVQKARNKFQGTVREIAKMRKQGKEIPKNLIRAERALMAEASRLEKEVLDLQEKIGMTKAPPLKEALKSEGRTKEAEAPAAPPLELRPLEPLRAEVTPEAAALPGMEAVIQKAREAVGEYQRDQMEETMRTPREVPTQPEFGKPQPTPEQIEAKMAAMRRVGIDADEAIARDAILREREEPSMFALGGVPPPGMFRRAFPRVAEEWQLMKSGAQEVGEKAMAALRARFAKGKGPMAEAEATLKVTPEMETVASKIEDFGTRLTDQAQLIADQIENIRETGTLQPKEVREGIKHEGRPTPTRKVSESMVKNINAQLVALEAEMSKIRQAAELNGTPRMNKLLQAAEQEFNRFVEEEYKPTRRAAGRTVRAYQEPVPDRVVQELRKLGIAMKEASKPGISDMIYEAWINALLSSPKTHLVNTTSNLLVRMTAPFERLGEAGVDFLRAKMTGTPRERFFGEFSADAYGLMAGWREALTNAAHAWQHETAIGATKLEQVRPKAIPGKAGRAVRIPGRALVAEDEFFKALNYSAAKHSFAYRQAAKEGLEGRVRAARIAELVKQEAGEIHEQAMGEMFYRVFQKELGPFARGVQALRAKSWPFRYIVPFLKTPINIAKYGLERTPLEFLHLLYKQTQPEMRVKGGELSAAVAKPLGGSLVGAAIVMLASEGKITGGGPTDPNERRTLYETGWQPYSVKIGERYYSYGRLEPLGVVLGLSADYYEAFDEMEKDEQADITGKIMFALSQNFTNKTFLRGISDLVLAISDPERYGGRYVSGLAGTVVPTVVAEAARATDPYFRKPESVGQALKGRVPGVSRGVEPARGVFGAPQEREGGFLQKFVSPVQVSRAKGGEVEKELVRLGMGFGKPSKTIKIDGEETEMTPQEFGQYQELRGSLAREWLTNLLQDPFYQEATDEEKKNLIRGIFSEAGQYGRDQILTQRETGTRQAEVR